MVHLFPRARSACGVILALYLGASRCTSGAVRRAEGGGRREKSLNRIGASRAYLRRVAGASSRAARRKWRAVSFDAAACAAAEKGFRTLWRKKRRDGDLA